MPWALGHLSAVEHQPAVAEYLLGQGQAQRHKHDGPIDGVEAHNLLTHQMHVGGPVLVEFAVALLAVAQGGDIVGQRVDPYVDHVLGVKIHRHAPGETGPGDAQVLQSGQQEILQHLVGPLRGLDELGMVLDILDQPGGVLAHTEEIRLLRGLLHRLGRSPGSSRP